MSSIHQHHHHHRVTHDGTHHLFCVNPVSLSCVDTSSSEPHVLWSIPTRVLMEPPRWKSYGSKIEETMFLQLFSSSHANEKFPKAWSTLVGALRSTEGCALKLEGIFRISGETTAVNTLCQRLDDELWTLEGTDNHVIAHALKRWIGGLASPLVPHNVHAAILDAMRKGDPDEVVVPKLHQLLQALPNSSACVFIDLLQLLGETLVHRATNLMTETSLATIFSPLVLQSQKDLTAFMQNMELERRWMELLILNPPNPSCFASATPSSVVLTQNIVPFPDAVTLAV